MKNTNFFIMNENNYLVEFIYNGKMYQAPVLSHNDFEKAPNLVKSDAAISAARNFISMNNLEAENAKIESITLFGKEAKVLLHEDYK